MKFKFFFAQFFIIVLHVNAQDPHYTQFTAAPFTVNPAYTGVFNGTARFMSNYRQQWANLIDPFNTALVAADVKVGKTSNEQDQHPLNIGVQLMQDKSMAGAFRSNYGGLMASYHVNLDAAENQSIGAGLSINYGNRRIDFSNISFDRQFTSGGFDLSLPNGESAMQNMNPFYSVGAGLLFRSNNPSSGTFFEAGFSGYHFNKPIQTVFNDPNQVLPTRWSGQITFQKYIDDVNLLNIRGLYQQQADVSYLLTGISYARLFGGANTNMIGAGLWYRSKESFAPYAFVETNGIQIGFSYDITYNSMKKFLTPAGSFELSIQWRVGNILVN